MEKGFFLNKIISLIIKKCIYSNLIELSIIFIINLKEENIKYPFLTLTDETEIVYSELLSDGTVEVYIEKPDEKDCFHSASCFLPGYVWKNINGFTKKEIKRYQDIIESSAHLILNFAQKGGSENASNFKKLESFVIPVKYNNSEDTEKYIQTLRQDRNFY